MQSRTVPKLQLSFENNIFIHKIFLQKHDFYYLHMIFHVLYYFRIQEFVRINAIYEI